MWGLIVTEAIKIAAQVLLSPDLFLFASTSINICALSSPPWPRFEAERAKDGSTYVQVLYRLDGKQTSTPLEDMASAAKFQKLARKFGPARALEAIRTDPEST